MELYLHVLIYFHGAVLIYAQGKFYLIFAFSYPVLPSYKLKGRVTLLSCHRAPQLYRIERLLSQPLGHPVTASVLRDTIAGEYV